MTARSGPLRGQTRSGKTATGLGFSVQGAGQAVLLLAGFGWPAATLDEVAAVLSGRFTCIRFDYRGTGRSAAQWGSVSTTSMARDAVSVLQHVEVESAHVYGVSLGGMVAQEIAIERPDIVDRLVLVSTTAGGWRTVHADPSDLLWSLRDGRSRVHDIESTPFAVSLLHGWAAGTHNSAHRLAKISAPTLVMHGDRDRMLPVGNARFLASRIPRSELRVLADEGHLFNFTDAGRVTREASEWLVGRPPARREPSTLCPPTWLAPPSVFDVLLPSWHGCRMGLKLARVGLGIRCR